MRVLQHLIKGTPVVTLGFGKDIAEALLRAGVLTLEDLEKKTEFQVCRALLPDDHGYGMSNELASQAVKHFEVVRSWMDRHGRQFRGGRRTLNDLWLSF